MLQAKIQDLGGPEEAQQEQLHFTTLGAQVSIRNQ